MALVHSITILLYFTALSYVASDINYEKAKVALKEYIEKKKKDINPRYRPLYHLAPPVGWMNDPNGFSYHNGEFHLFYQYYPYDSIWGPMHWGHSSSLDLVNWKELPTALLPETEQCFSGSAISENNTMILMYTGRRNTSVEPYFNESQYLAFSTDGIDFTKYEHNPVLPGSPSGAPDFRDPKVWKYDNDFYVVIGTKTLENQGSVLLYKSKDLRNWEIVTVLDESKGDLGYMWECPDFFELNGKFVLLMSPQGMHSQGDRYKNTFQNGYIIGSFNYTTNEFVREQQFQEIDYGHDFYAATTTEANGKRYIVAWHSMWEVSHPEAVDGWVGQMTLPRELSIVNNRILMKPVETIVNLRVGVAVDGNIGLNEVREFGKAVELFIDSDLNRTVNLLLEGRDGGGNIRLRWNPEDHKVVVDRDSGDIRQVEWSPINSTTWRVFLDASSIELFCGEGEVVFSSRAYPLGGWKLTNQSPQSVHVKAFNLKTNSGIVGQENGLRLFIFIIISNIFVINLSYPLY
ncbi:unnamed protein product [Euphydryas editha]|uniref:Sucrose-6-phosphate hydrolase n=1 Tax=Euphydryas editha TaxID=104508 RepID=A0AAU9V626_EUPED|nr:unnamed protein product [Euphydryas editha]